METSSRTDRKDVQRIFGESKVMFHEERLGPYLHDYAKKLDSLDRLKGLVPVTMELDLTNVCTHQCPLCTGIRSSEANGERLYTVAADGEEMPVAKAAVYICQMAAAGVKALIFTGGGEPTVYKQLVALIQRANELGMDVALITHGGLLHKHDMPSLVEACSWIRISIDAGDAKQFRDVHGSGNSTREWHQVWENVTALCEQRTVNKSSCTIGVAFLAGKENVSGMLKCAMRAARSGADYFQVRPFHGQLAFDPRHIIEEVRCLCDKAGYTMSIVASDQKYSQMKNGQPVPRDYDHCHLTQFASVICANEKMYVCCHLRNMEQFCIGDLRKNTFEEIIQSQHRATVNDGVKVSKCLPLCRGDYTNRLVELLVNVPIADAEEQVTTAGFHGKTPTHVNFL